MKRSVKHRLGASILFGLAVTAAADPGPQPQVTFNPAAPGTFAADWQGVEGRTYLLQWSLDLHSWFYCPFLEFGEGFHSYGVAGSTERLFFRLHYGEFPGINSLDDALEADLDGDGLSNAFEITYGYSPFQTASTIDGDDNAHDPEGDGMSNADESSRGLNPMKMDNPKVLLQVTTE